MTHCCDDCLQEVHLDLESPHSQLVVRIACPNCGEVSKKRPVDPVPHWRDGDEWVPVAEATA
jgi:transcription initiation factor TFIIIB Brf1 subunit/transcription initiation factor TFIIB